MRFKSSKEMLNEAKKGKYAIGAFNVENMEMIKATIDVAYEYKSPIILTSSTNALKYVEPIVISSIVGAFLTDKTIDLALHLDHGNDIALVSKCLKAGYSSIMYDGSHFSYIDNVNLTKQVVDLCHLFDVPVEGELGAIGGKSDATNIDLAYTKADTANDFVCKTSVDSLAVAIGTAHGIYKSTPKLDYQRCDEIRNCVDVPLVLHGASGLTFEQVRNCIESGICKVNNATELRIAYTKAVSEYCENHPENYDPKKYGVEAIENVKKVVLEKLKTVNSIGRSCKFAPKLIVIDFDGTIVDSEKIYQNAWIEASHYFNYDLNKNDALKLRSCDSSIAQQVFSSSELYQNIKKYRKKLMKDYGNSTFYELKNGIFEGLSFLKKEGYNVIIVSSSDPLIINKHLNYYFLNEYISDVVSAKEVTRGKPYPDIYLYLSKKFNIKPEEILVVEDSPNGILSAKFAGCKTIMIPDLSEPDNALLNKIDVVLPDFSYIKNVF